MQTKKPPRRHRPSLKRIRGTGVRSETWDNGLTWGWASDTIRPSTVSAPDNSLCPLEFQFARHASAKPPILGWTVPSHDGTLTAMAGMRPRIHQLQRSYGMA